MMTGGNGLYVTCIIKVYAKVTRDIGTAREGRVKRGKRTLLRRDGRVRRGEGRAGDPS